jgi:hypothetical protein
MSLFLHPPYADIIDKTNLGILFDNKNGIFSTCDYFYNIRQVTDRSHIEYRYIKPVPYKPLPFQVKVEYRGPSKEFPGNVYKRLSPPPSFPSAGDNS